MNQTIFTVCNNIQIADAVFELTLEGDTSAVLRSGQFVNIALDGFFLRRPISVCDRSPGRLVLVYKAVGSGTEHMSTLKKGAELDLLCGLGNGFDASLAGKKPLLAGGGVGTPPLYLLAKELISLGAKPLVVLGFGSKKDAFYTDKFESLGAEIRVATLDGSIGTPGFVTDAFDESDGFTYVYACGPLPMLNAVFDKTPQVGGQFSFEERMGCGFGACMGCTCKTKQGSKRICKEGPVLFREEIIR